MTYTSRFHEFEVRFFGVATPLSTVTLISFSMIVIRSIAVSSPFEPYFRLNLGELIGDGAGVVSTRIFFRAGNIDVRTFLSCQKKSYRLEK